MTIFDHPREGVGFIGTERVALALRHCDADYWKVFHFRFLEGFPFPRPTTGRAAGRGDNAATERRSSATDRPWARRSTSSGASYRVVGVVADVPVLRRLTNGEIYVPFGAIQDPGYRSRMKGTCVAAFLMEGPHVHQELRSASRSV